MAEQVRTLARPNAALTANRQIVAALQSAMAVNAAPADLEYVLARAMAKAFADMGYKAADRNDEIVYLVQTMPAEVLTHLPGIKLDEIPIAINRGVLRAYGDFFGLNVATFMFFLTSYYRSEQRAAAVKALQPAAATTTAPNAAQLQLMRLNRIKAAFATYQSTGTYHDYGSLVFDSLNRMYKIPFSRDKEQQLLQQARQNLIAQWSKGPVDAIERASLRQKLNQLLAGESSGLIVTEAKRLALFELFDYLIEMEVAVEEFLEEGG